MRPLQVNPLASLSTLPWLPDSYRDLAKSLLPLPDPEQTQFLRYWLRTDLWFLLRVGLHRKDMEHPWLFARCQEVQRNPDGHLDLWARGHYKSTIITFGKTLQDILASHGTDPLPSWGGLEPTFCIFSHTRPIAKAFLRQIKNELERNLWLRELFPDILYASPEKQSPRWSEDAGIVVKRQSNPKEATVEAWGLVDGQPTSKHFNVLLWDDVVTRESVSNPDMIRKTTESWELSLNLGDREPRKRMAGTRYSFADTYREVMNRQAMIPRLYPATDDGTLKGNPVLLTVKQFEQKVREMGPYTASAQLLQNPIADSKQTFKREWFDNRYLDLPNWEGMNRCLLCDPASEKKKTSDYTVMLVLGRHEDGNTYLLDGLRDRLNLRERGDAFMRLHRKWKPQRTGYERYGMQADVEYIKERQGRDNYRFELDEVGGTVPKIDRVNRLIPLCSEGKLWVPDTLYKTNTEGRTYDLIEVLIEEEALAWPVPPHDDILDCMARIYDLEDFSFPMGAEEEEPRRERYRPVKSTSWMSR